VSEDCPREHGAAGKPNVSVIPCQEAQCVGSAGELLRIETNHPRLPQALRPFVVTEAALEVDHAQSLSTDQVQGLATSVWQALLPSVGGTPSDQPQAGPPQAVAPILYGQTQFLAQV
jgi:hypothetical protein